MASELPVALHSPRVERIVVDAHYAQASRYRSDVNRRSGLFPFEGRMLEAYFPKPPADLFVPGVGGGRELVALGTLGYRIASLEPVASLREAANRVRPASCAPVWGLSLQEWVAAPEGRFDGIFLGWGLWAHLTAHADRLAALRAFRQACPKGPLLMSFFRRAPVFDVHERAEPAQPLYPEPTGRLQQLTRGALRQKLLGLSPLERGVGWARGYYFHATNRAELTEEAGEAGWSVQYFEEDVRRYPHAVLTAA